MDSQRVPFLSWAHFYQGKGIDELRQALVLTTMELEGTRLKAQEELKMREDQLFELKDLLNRAIKERDEAHDQCQRLIIEKLLIQQQQQHQQHQQQHQQQLMLQLSQNKQNHGSAPLSGVSSIEDEPIRAVDSSNGFSSSDCEESIVSSPVIDPIHRQQQEMPPQLQQSVFEEQHDPTFIMLADRPLPEKGNLLQAVMKAGPLLQTLLLAGPLPQWRHPPPPLDTYQIPPPPVLIPSPTPSPKPVFSAGSLHQDSLLSTFPAYNGIKNNCGTVNRKRVISEGSDSSTENKYQRLVLQ